MSSAAQFTTSDTNEQLIVSELHLYFYTQLVSNIQIEHTGQRNTLTVNDN